MVQCYPKGRVAMQKWAKYCRIGMWISLVVFGTMQWLGIIGILINNFKPGADPYTIWPMMIAIVVLTAAVIAYSFAKSGQLLYLIVAGLATFAIVASALDIWQVFNVDAVYRGGLTLWTWLYRHLGTVLVTVCMLASYILERIAERRDMFKQIQDVQNKISTIK